MTTMRKEGITAEPVGSDACCDADSLPSSREGFFIPGPGGEHTLSAVPEHTESVALSCFSETLEDMVSRFSTCMDSTAEKHVDDSVEGEFPGLGVDVWINGLRHPLGSSELGSAMSECTMQSTDGGRVVGDESSKDFLEGTTPRAN